jgi:tRNA-splicing ligase RtcB
MTRTDPYQERARELAIAAGLDPDTRIERPGQRSMPVWCTFRDAARAEHQAREASALSAEIGPQAAEFQNAPLQVFGEHDDATIAQMRNCMGVGNVVAGAICADGHLGYAQPVGGVIAYEKQISISGVGFDIGCGNMAVRLDVPYSTIADKVGPIIKDVARVISFGIGRTNEERVEHELFDDGDAWTESDMHAYRQKAVAQLGTVGSGNHYVDLMRDEDGLVWIGVHFGSRGLGHTSATRYLKLADGKDGMHVAPAVIDEDSELGRRYIAAMQLAGRYSYAGREWVVERVRRIIGGEVTDMVHNHHNYAWRENHGGRDVWVVRKGATPAFPGQRGFVGRLDGRRRGDPGRRGQPAGQGGAVLHDPRRRPPVRPQGGQAPVHPRGDGPVAAGARRRAGRGGPRRKPDGLPPPAGGARPSRRLGVRAAHAAAVRGRDGGRRGVRSVQGLKRRGCAGAGWVARSRDPSQSDGRKPL